MHDIPRFRDFVEGARRPNFIYIRNDEVYGSFFQKLLSEEKNSSYQRMPLLRQHHLQKTVWYHDSASISRLVKPYLSEASIKSIPLSFHSPAVMLPTYMYRNRRRNTLGWTSFIGTGSDPSFFSHSEARMDPLAQVFNTNLWALKISLKGGGRLSPLKEISDVFFIWEQLLQHILHEGQNARFVPWSKLLPCATGIDVTSATTASCCDFEKFQHPNSL